MTIYQRGDSWVVTVGSGADRYRKSFKSQPEAILAEKKERAIREGIIERQEPIRKARSGSKQGVSLGYSLGDAFRIALKDTWSQNRSQTHLKTARAVLEFIGEDTPVADIKTSLIREMVEEFEDSGNSGSTVNKKLSALSMMLKAAAGEGWIELMPMIKRRSGGTKRIRWMDAEEELKVVAVCDQLGLTTLRDFIIVGIDTGFRRMELLNFRVKDYKGGLMNLYADQTKTAKARAIPATDRVAEIIKHRQHNVRLFDDLTANKLRRQWEVLRSTMGMNDDPQFVIHMLRHTCATRMAMQDKTAEFIQKWMGHSTPLTTALYMHLAPNKLMEGKSALDEYRKTHQPKLRLA